MTQFCASCLAPARWRDAAGRGFDERKSAVGSGRWMFSLPGGGSMRILMAVIVAIAAGSVHAAPLRKATPRPTTCVGGQCAKAVTAPVRVVRRVVGR